jgi:hypothetical protein
MCPPAGTRARSIVVAAHMPDADSNVASAPSKALPKCRRIIKKLLFYFFQPLSELKLTCKFQGITTPSTSYSRNTAK